MKKFNLSLEDVTDEEMRVFIIAGLNRFFKEGAISEMASIISAALETEGEHWTKPTSQEPDEYYETILRLHNIWEEIYNQTCTGSLEDIENQLVEHGIMTPKLIEYKRLNRAANELLDEETSDN